LAPHLPTPPHRRPEDASQKYSLRPPPAGPFAPAVVIQLKSSLEDTVGKLCVEVQSLRAVITAHVGTSARPEAITNHINTAGGDAVHRKTVTHHHHGMAGTNAATKPISRPATDGAES
jgi:hypothetical protein